jgi:hypothetical protein
MELGTGEAKLKDSDNPAAVVVQAHLEAQATRGDMELRKKSKWQLTRRLYERGYSRQDILELFRLIDWLMVLPEGLGIEFRRELMEFEQEKVMPYITSIERIGREEGWQEGRQEGRQEALRENIFDVLQARFGAASEAVRPPLGEITGETRLKDLLRRAALADSLNQFLREI